MASDTAMRSVWTRLQSGKESQFTPRAAVFTGREFFIYGSVAGGEEDIYILNLDSLQWSRLDAPTPATSPPPVFEYSRTCYSSALNAVLLVGGGQIWSFHLVSHTWEQIQLQHPRGTPPLPTDGFSVCVFEPQSVARLVICGGTVDQGDKLLKPAACRDVFIVDLASTSVSTTALPPSFVSRCGHALCSIPPLASPDRSTATAGRYPFGGVMISGGVLYSAGNASALSSRSGNQQQDQDQDQEFLADAWMLAPMSEEAVADWTLASVSLESTPAAYHIVARADHVCVSALYNGDRVVVSMCGRNLSGLLASPIICNLDAPFLGPATDARFRRTWNALNASSDPEAPFSPRRNPMATILQSTQAALPGDTDIQLLIPLFGGHTGTSWSFDVFSLKLALPPAVDGQALRALVRTANQFEAKIDLSSVSFFKKSAPLPQSPPSVVSMEDDMYTSLATLFSFLNSWDEVDLAVLLRRCRVFDNLFSFDTMAHVVTLVGNLMPVSASATSASPKRLAPRPINEDMFFAVLRGIAEAKGLSSSSATPEADAAQERGRGPLQKLFDCFLWPNLLQYEWASEILAEDRKHIRKLYKWHLLIPVLETNRSKLEQVFVTYSTLEVLATYAPTWEDVVRHECDISLPEAYIFADHFGLVPQFVHRHFFQRRLFAASSHADPASASLDDPSHHPALHPQQQQQQRFGAERDDSPSMMRSHSLYFKTFFGDGARRARLVSGQRKASEESRRHESEQGADTASDYRDRDRDSYGNYVDSGNSEYDDADDGGDGDDDDDGVDFDGGRSGGSMRQHGFPSSTSYLEQGVVTAYARLASRMSLETRQQQKLKLKRSSGQSIGLNFSEFVELLVRSARAIGVSFEKLLDLLEFNNERFFRDNLRKAGLRTVLAAPVLAAPVSAVGSPGNAAVAAAPPAAGARSRPVSREAPAFGSAEMMQVLRGIFLFYCSYGDYSGSCSVGLSLPKFIRLLRDCDLFDTKQGFLVAQTEQLVSGFIKDKIGGKLLQKTASDTLAFNRRIRKAPLMTFEDFLDLLRGVASWRLPGDSDAYQQLLERFILPNAGRLDEVYMAVPYWKQTTSILELLRPLEAALKLVFLTYARLSEADSIALSAEQNKQQLAATAVGSGARAGLPSPATTRPTSIASRVTPRRTGVAHSSAHKSPSPTRRSAAMSPRDRRRSPQTPIFTRQQRQDMQRQHLQLVANERVSIGELFRLAMDFDFLPSVVSRGQLFRVFRSALFDSSASSKATVSSATVMGMSSHLLLELDFSQFVDCLVRLSVAAFSRHPYDERYPTVEAKVYALLSRMHLEDMSKTKAMLEKRGYRPPPVAALNLLSFE